MVKNINVKLLLKIITNLRNVIDFFYYNFICELSYKMIINSCAFEVL